MPLDREIILVFEPKSTFLSKDLIDWVGIAIKA